MDPDVKQVDLAASARPPTAAASGGDLRTVNDFIWRSLQTGGREEPIAFFCECGEAGCCEPVWLTPTDYEQLRGEPRASVLASGHVGALAEPGPPRERP